MERAHLLRQSRAVLKAALAAPFRPDAPDATSAPAAGKPAMPVGLGAKRRPSMTREGVTLPESGLLSGVAQLVQKGADVGRLTLLLGAQFEALRPAMERALAAALRNGEVALVHRSMPLAMLLGVSKETLEVANEFLLARPEVVAELEDAVARSQLPSAAIRAPRTKNAGRRSSTIGKVTALGAGAAAMGRRQSRFGSAL